jgi:hypothetical protein
LEQTNDRPDAPGAVPAGPSAPPGHWWFTCRRWLGRLAILLFLALLGCAGYYAWWRHHVAVALRAAEAELDRTDPGWRLEEIEAGRAEIPDDENSARIVVAVWDAVPRGRPYAELSTRLARVGPEERLEPGLYARLREELDRAAPAVELARRLADLPRGRHRIEYAPEFPATRLDDQQHARFVVQLLGHDAWRRAHEGDTDGALTSCRAALNAARSIGDEPVSISQLARAGGVMEACKSAERVLAQGEPTPGALAALQKLLEEEDEFPAEWVALRGERAALHRLFLGYEDGSIPVVHLDSQNPGHGETRRFLRAWADRDRYRAAHPALLDVMSRLVEDARKPVHQQTRAAQLLAREAQLLAAAGRQREQPGEAWNWALLADHVRSGSLTARHAWPRTTAAALAAERYRRAHSRWPETLDALVPKFLAAVPLDPYDGQPLRCAWFHDGVAIYSVGPARKDYWRTSMWKARSDTSFGIRLWDVAGRRQLPRPRVWPVSPDDARE